MDSRKQVVVQIPLTGLWNDHGPLEAVKGRELTADDIRALLSLDSTSFVVADTGLPLKWILDVQRFDFWKSDGKSHLRAEGKPYLGDYPGEYFYIAHEWLLRDGESVIVLEKYH